MWLAGWVAVQGTLQVRPCKLGRRIHAAHAPCTAYPPCLRQFPAAARHGRKKEEQQRSRASLARSRAWLGSTRAEPNKGRGERRVLFVFHQFVSNPMLFLTVTGKLSGWGGVGWQDRWRHGPEACLGRVGQDAHPGLAVCAGQRTRARRHRAPRGEGALLAKHCFASARTHSRQRLGRTAGRVHGVSCQPTPPHPTSSNPEPLWLWLWLWLWLSAVDVARRRRTTARQRGAPRPTRSGSSRRCRRCRNSRSDSSPGTAGGSPRRSSTPVPGTRSRW